MHAVMARGKGVPVHVNEYLRDWLAREWLAKGHTQQELADKAEVNKTTVSDFRNSKRGAGYDLFVAFARILGRSRDDIERGRSTGGRPGGTPWSRRMTRIPTAPRRWSSCVATSRPKSSTASAP